MRTEQLQVIQVVGAAAGSRYHVIHVEHLEREPQIAAIAPTCPAPNTPSPALPFYSLFAPETSWPTSCLALYYSSRTIHPTRVHLKTMWRIDPYS